MQYGHRDMQRVDITVRSARSAPAFRRCQGRDIRDNGAVGTRQAQFVTRTGSWRRPFCNQDQRKHSAARPKAVRKPMGSTGRFRSPAESSARDGNSAASADAGTRMRVAVALHKCALVLGVTSPTKPIRPTNVHHRPWTSAAVRSAAADAGTECQGRGHCRCQK